APVPSTHPSPPLPLPDALPICRGGAARPSSAVGRWGTGRGRSAGGATGGSNNVRLAGPRSSAGARGRPAIGGLGATSAGSSSSGERKGRRPDFRQGKNSDDVLF